MKVLFIAGHEFLEKQDNGGRQCSYRNYMILQEILGKENIYLCMFSNVTQSSEETHIQTFPTHENKLMQIKNTIFLRNGYNKSTERSVVKYINAIQVDILFFDFSITGSLINKIEKNKKVIVFLHNIEKQYMMNKVKHDGLQYLFPFVSYYYNEKNIVRKADKIICLNKRDSDLLWECYGRRADFLMPVTFKDVYDIKEAEKYKKMKFHHRRKQLLFVGSLFAPNYDGILWFVKNVMPELTDCCLTIVGKDMEKKNKELSASNVEVAGSVENLSMYYYKADAVIIPILYGDGMKVKTAEAMMYGKPVFATKEALEGYEVDGVDGIWECNDKEEFIRSITQYAVEDNGKYEENIRRVYLEKYETESLKGRICDFLGEV